MHNPRRIAIVGPESTGKSQLAQALANHYQCPWVPEVARNYFIQHPNKQLHYNQADVETIANQQIKAENQMAQNKPHWLMCDTNLLVIQIWMENAFGNAPAWIAKHWQSNRYQLHLLANIDLPWQPDPLREHPNKRQFFFDWYLRNLNQAGVPYAIISGQGPQRVLNAQQAIDSFFEQKN